MDVGGDTARRQGQLVWVLTPVALLIGGVGAVSVFMVGLAVWMLAAM